MPEPNADFISPGQIDIKQILYAIIVGDSVGAKYENRCLASTVTENYQSVELLHPRKNNFTDDSVMSIAIYKAMSVIKTHKLNEKDSLGICIHWMKKLASLYPDAGYGGHFYQWAVLDEENPNYKSYGDGSAMRSGIIGAMFDNVKDVIKYSAIASYPTHSHPEGMKGGIVTAVLVWMSLHGYTKEEMKSYVCKHYPKRADTGRYFNVVYAELTMDELLKHEKYQTLGLECWTAVPLAWINFYESDTYEGCLRNCLRYASDTDTVMAISAGFAEAYYQNNQLENRTLESLAKEYLSDYLYMIIQEE